MAGALIAPVEDGKIKETESQTSLKNAKDKKPNSYSASLPVPRRSRTGISILYWM